MEKYRLYSVGHSNQSQEEFLQLLLAHDVNCIVDVRSVPASKYTPQFNMEPLKWFLKSHDIQYRFSLVSRYFYDNGLDVQHILKGAEIVSHKALEDEMIQEYLHAKKHRQNTRGNHHYQKE